jgi:uncharacterized Zn finger protein (UPF0148 family)
MVEPDCQLCKQRLIEWHGVLFCALCDGAGRHEDATWFVAWQNDVE